MDKKTRILAIVAAVGASILIISSPSGSIMIPKPNTSPTGTDAVQIVGTNLQKPWAMTFSDGKIFLTEKVRRIKVVDNGILVNESVADFHVVDVTEGGLLGITVHPDFKKNHYIYVYYTYSEGNKLCNKVLRITESNDRMANAKVILDKIPVAEFDDGGVIKFGPDKKLYIGTGDATNEDSAQDLNSLAGKILRLNDDGSIPYGNPILNSSVYSYGHRNPQGLAWNDKGNLYETEEGPTKNDEVNLVQPGQNNGWPNQECSGSKDIKMRCYVMIQA